MHFAAVFTLVLPVIVTATAIPRWAGDRNCNTGALQCCNSVKSADTQTQNDLGGLLGIGLGSITGLIGLDCTPINVIGLSGNSCSAQPVCCSNNNFGGLVSLGCTPVNLNV